MLYAEISRVLGRFFFYLAAVCLIPFCFSLFYEFSIDKTVYFKTSTSLAFLETIGVCLLLGKIFQRGGRQSTGKLYRKESALLVVLIWFMTAAIASLPFIFTGAIPSPVDAYFESMSGLTTTGASVLHPKKYDAETGKEIPHVVQNPVDPSILYSFYGTVPPLKAVGTSTVLKEGVEALGKPLLFWRSFLQWLGGMGIVVLFIAVLPALSLGGKFLYETEVAGVNKEGVKPRIQETASLLWKFYLGITLLQVCCLLITNSQMSLFEAVNISFSTISTGGFSVTNDGLATYANTYTYWIVATFMLLGSLNFTLYFHALKGKVGKLYEPEFFLYLLIILGGSLLMTFNLWNTPKSLSSSYPGYFTFSEALSTGFFQAISAQSSTGFFLGNYDFWPFSCQFLMIVLMFIGGMSGSTTGGIKVIRYAVILKVVKNKIESLFRPEQVRAIKIGPREIGEKTALTVLTFACVVVLFFGIGAYLLMIDHNDIQTALGTIACMINNTGLLFGGVGCTGSFAFLSPFSKIVSILWMVLGRLEYFAFLVLFVPAFWRKR